MLGKTDKTFIMNQKRIKYSIIMISNSASEVLRSKMAKNTCLYTVFDVVFRIFQKLEYRALTLPGILGNPGF